MFQKNLNFVSKQTEKNPGRKLNLRFTVFNFKRGRLKYFSKIICLGVLS